MKKSIYTDAKIEIIYLANCDIVTTSGDDLTHVDPDDSSWD